MAVLKNKKICLEIQNGRIFNLYDPEEKERVNLVMENGNTGAVSYTYMTDDITENAENLDFVPYVDRMCVCQDMEMIGNNVVCNNKKCGMQIKYSLEEELVIELECRDEHISELALNFDFNFMGMKGTNYKKQILPTSPYSSNDGRYLYYTMTRPEGKFITVLAETPSDGWRIKYSDVNVCHYIDSLQFFASFDKKFSGSGRKKIKLRVFFSETIEDVYHRAGEIYKVPYCFNVTNGGFGAAFIKCSSNMEYMEIMSPSKKIERIKPDEKGIVQFSPEEYGMYMATPVKEGKRGLSSTIWSGGDYDVLYKKSCDSIKKPYHGDYNLCEGGMFLWALLLYMNKTKTRNYEEIVQSELEIIMGENGNNVPRKTILPYKTDKYEAYHISDSDRIQEQFVGVSILLEAYKFYKKEKYINHAINALDELMTNRLSDDGMIYRFNEEGEIEDYTTVYAPMINIVDMALFLRERGDVRAEKFVDASIKISDFLVTRDLSFPTEGQRNWDKEPEMEDGSISCTALSVLYVYHYIKRDDRYLMFAKKILDLHETWTIYTSDARMYQSSFRWWETIWEGDGAGPAICAGHAWTIWRAEALFWYGIEAKKDEYLLKSWNGFVTNFSKINKKGESYACYEVDYIRGGGAKEIREGLLQLQGEDIAKKYELAHDHPKHTDASLSRYVWIRSEATWANTAAILNVNGNLIGININKKKNKWFVKEDIKKIYIGNIAENEKIIVNNQSVDIRNDYLKIAESGAF